jgi:hypothetical protein
VQVLQQELEKRWEAMFTALQAGDDVPPALRLRTEGLMEAAVLLELATPVQLLEAMQRYYRSAFGCGIDEDFGCDWQVFFPFPQIPAMSKRAPVHPSTPD